MSEAALLSPATCLLVNGWSPSQADSWEEALVEGRGRLAAVRRLSATDPASARLAIRVALTDPRWREAVVRSSVGAEHGFAEALAHAAVAHFINQRHTIRRDIS